MADKKIRENIFEICTFAMILLLAGILVLLLFGNGYALFFDRSDQFFGELLEGDCAGITLFIKVIISGILLVFLIFYPRYFTLFVKISLIFSGILLADSVVTTWTTITGYRSFSPVIGLYFLFSMALFVIHRIRPDLDSP